MEKEQSYIGISFTDMHNKTVTLTEQGISISRSRGLLGHKFERMLPYTLVTEITGTAPAGFTKPGYLSLLTPADIRGTHKRPLTVEETNAVVEDETSFLYRKKSAETVETMRKAIEEMKAEQRAEKADVLRAFEGMCFIGMMGKKIELTQDGVMLSKDADKKIIRYANIREVYVSYPNSSMDTGILSVVEDNGPLADQKLRQLKTERPITFSKDENSILLSGNVKSQAEKMYHAINLIREYHL